MDFSSSSLEALNKNLPQKFASIDSWRSVEATGAQNKNDTKTGKITMDGWNFDPSSLLNSISTNKTNSSSSNRLDANAWDGNLALLSNFGSIEYEGGGGQSEQQATTYSAGETAQDSGHYPQSSTTDAQSHVEASRSAAAVSESTSVNSGGIRSGSASISSRAAGMPTNDGSSASAVESQLHPLAIQSSATCPPHSSSSSVVDSIPGGNAATNNPYDHFNTSDPTSSGYFGLHGIDSTAIASLAASFQNPSNTQQPARGSQSMHYQRGGHHHGGEAASRNPSAQVHGQYSRSTSASTSPQLGPGHSHGAKRSRSSSTGVKPRSATVPPGPPGSNPPPFYLFDAPVELRTNFMQNQKRLGLPIQHDPNSYHFGEVVKGFHPQQLMNQQQLSEMLANSMQDSANRIPEGPVKLIDARHGKPKSSSLSGRVKNEREQKRAQKITELIERIRLDMEKGGWTIELRSKFHTLSKCAEYVKHMIKETKQKEETIKKLNSDLEVKKRKIEEDKSAQESRSDPESVTSSLTSDTNASLRHTRLKACTPPTKKQKVTGDVNVNDGSTMRAAHTTSSQNMSSIATNEDSSGGGEDRGSGGSGTGSGGPSAQGFSVDKTEITGVSDLTDSNRASSSSNSGSGDGSGKTQSVSQNPVEQSQPSGNSISSDAAVASQRTTHGNEFSKEHQHNHKDVVVDHGQRAHRKRSAGAMTSKGKKDDVDYEEIFATSNVPQLIATASGKVVAWNQCFLKATGARRTEAEKMTIFSLVRHDKLSSVFELVAQVLKGSEENEKEDEEKDTRAENAGEMIPSDDKDSAAEKVMQSLAAFPCIDFPAMRKRRAASENEMLDTQLFMTVTFMGQEAHPRRRFFHCVFTNCMGRNGNPGVLSPELLASMYTPQERPQKKSKRHHHRKHSKGRGRVSPAEENTPVPSAISHQLKEENVDQDKGDDSEETVTDRPDHTTAIDDETRADR